MFSRRLPGEPSLNRLAAAERDRRAAGLPILDLTVSNPTLVGLQYPAAELAAALSAAAGAAYHPAPLGLEAARVAIAGDYRRRAAAVDPRAIALTASSSESYALLFKLLCDPGDAVLVPEPSYPLFEHLARFEGVVPRPYRLTWDGRWTVDWSSVDPAGARAVIAVSPNNPTGSFVSGGDLQKLQAMAAEHGLALIVDEVFADYPLAPPADAVDAVAARPAPGLTFSLGGLSKSCGLPHLKLGWMAVTGPPALVEAALGRLELLADTYLSVGTPVQLALPRLLAAGAGVRAQIDARVKENRAVLTESIGPESPCTLLPAEAGWSAIVRVPAVMSDEEWAVDLLTRDGLLVQPGYFFDLRLGAALVVSLLTPPDQLRAGIGCVVDRAAAF